MAFAVNRYFIYKAIRCVIAEGTIKKIVDDKGFGFISTEGPDLFFHRSNVEEANFDELREGDRVQYTEAQGQKGPCAENVKPV